MRALWIAVVVAACTKAPPDTAAETRRVHPDLVCPAGTIEAGHAPPRGQEVWCHKSAGGGAWTRHGPAIAWHDNEQKAATGSYEEGKRVGAWQFYYPTGQLEKQGAYVGGVEDGVWTTFHASGERKSEGEMVDGKPHGAWSYWAEDGSWTAGTWVLGARDGVWIEHDADGHPVSERVYKAGRMIGMREL